VFWQGDVSPKGRAAIAWGGIWAQLLVLAAAEAWLRAVGAPSSFTALRIVSTLIEANLWLIAVNLVPLPPLDGAEAWRLPILLGRALRQGEPTPPPAVPQGTTHDDDFEAGARRDEVKAIVSSLLDEARKP
ncbi:MAG: hypothetical protein JNK82_05990, partial [Myxococcaceae bacterium]|nr:hypothetical protein [Myxococcaceae bacterium]